MLPKRLALSILLLGIVLMLAACGNDNGDETSDSPSETVVPPATSQDKATSDAPEESGLNVAEAPGDEVPITKPTPPDGIVPTAPPPMESSFDSDGDGFYTIAELKLALEARVSEYEWPEGYVFSAERAHQNNTRDVPEFAVFENGSEYTIIGFPHMCAWAETWLAANSAGDTDLQETSMTQMQEVSLHNPMFTYIKDDLGDLFQRAVLGDIAPLQQFLDTNCTWDSFDSTPEASVPVPVTLSRKVMTES